LSNLCLITVLPGKWDVTSPLHTLHGLHSQIASDDLQDPKLLEQLHLLQEQQRQPMDHNALIMGAPHGKVGRPRRSSQMRSTRSESPATPTVSKAQHSPAMATADSRDTSPQSTSVDPDSSSGKEGSGSSRRHGKMDNKILKQLLSQYDQIPSPLSPVKSLADIPSKVNEAEPKKTNNVLLKVTVL